jgi:hypothetical protein
MNTKQTLINRRTALTLVVIFVVFLLAALILPNFASTGRPGRHSDFNCKANFKNIGMASASWAEDHGDLIPSKQTIANGGWADFLTNADQGAMCWTNYAIMADNYGLSPEELICPADERQPALGFTNKFNNLNVSYFVGVSASIMQPESIFGGDRNLGPGAIPTNDYGYSPKSGKGNDVTIPTDTSKGPVSWSLKMHSRASNLGIGYILFGDCHIQRVDTYSFNHDLLPNIPPTGNWPAGHFPATPSIRLVFP